MNTTKVFILWSFKNRVAIDIEPGFSLNSPIFDPSIKFSDIDRDCHPSLPMYMQCSRPDDTRPNFAIQVQMMMSAHHASAIDEYHIYVLDETCALLHTFANEEDIYEFDDERQRKDYRILVELDVTIASQSSDTYVSSEPIWLECRSKFVYNSDAHINFILYPSVPNGGPLIKRCQINGMATDWTLSILSCEQHHRKMELTWCRPPKNLSIIFQCQEHAANRSEMRFLIFDHHQYEHEMRVAYKLKNLLISSLGFIESTGFVTMNPNLVHKISNYVIAIVVADREANGGDVEPLYGSTVSLTSDNSNNNKSKKKKKYLSPNKEDLEKFANEKKAIAKVSAKNPVGFWENPSSSVVVAANGAPPTALPPPPPPPQQHAAAVAPIMVAANTNGAPPLALPPQPPPQQHAATINPNVQPNIINRRFYKNNMPAAQRLPHSFNKTPQQISRSNSFEKFQQMPQPYLFNKMPPSLQQNAAQPIDFNKMLPPPAVQPQQGPVIGDGGRPSEQGNFLREMLQAQQFCDVTLLVDHQEIRAHRIVLASRSSVFRHMLSVDESSTTYKLDDFDFDTMVTVIGFIYIGQLPGGGGVQYARLLEAADRYGIQTLKHYCENDLIANLSVGNVSTMLLLGHRFNATTLLSSAVNFVRANIGVVKGMDEFKRIFMQYPELGFELFRQCV